MARNYNPKPPTGQYRFTPKTKAEKFGASLVDYSSEEAVAKQLREIRTATARRIASLNKDSRTFSYAAYQFEQNMKQTYVGGKQPSLERMSFKQMEKELRMHHQFWASKTSTAAGAKDEMLRQSERIFGTDQSGRLNRTIGKEAGREFWKVYDEFYRVFKDSTAKLDSYRVQQLIGEQINRVISGDADLMQILQEVKNELDEMDSAKFTGEGQELIMRAVFSASRNEIDNANNPFETTLDIARRLNRNGNG